MADANFLAEHRADRHRQRRQPTRTARRRTKAEVTPPALPSPVNLTPARADPGHRARGAPAAAGAAQQPGRARTTRPRLNIVLLLERRSRQEFTERSVCQSCCVLRFEALVCQPRWKPLPGTSTWIRDSVAPNPPRYRVQKRR
jgi:hypothetical protein